MAYHPTHLLPLHEPAFQSRPNPALTSQTRLPKQKSKLANLKSASYSMANVLAGDVPSYIPGARIFNEALPVPDGVPGAHIFNEGAPVWHDHGTHYLCQGAALYDLISSKFDDVVTAIDEDRFGGGDAELMVRGLEMQQDGRNHVQMRGVGHKKEKVEGRSKGAANDAISSAVTSTNYFSKVDLYANSRLPPNLPPLKL